MNSARWRRHMGRRSHGDRLGLTEGTTTVRSLREGETEVMMKPLRPANAAPLGRDDDLVLDDQKRVLRIGVTEGDRQKVNITVTLALARLARIGAVSEELSKQGIDVEQILSGVDGMGDAKLVDVIDEKNDDHVEIYVETLGVAEPQRTEIRVDASTGARGR